jgi:hypothetical protein
MSKQQDEQTENLRELLRQHWLHCRHIESERAWFMSVYAAITGGMLAYIFTSEVKDLWPFYFLILLTLIGLLLNFRWKQAFEHHQEEAEAVANRLGAPVNLNIPANWFWKIFGTRFLFLYFYALILIGLIILVITKAIQG